MQAPRSLVHSVKQSKSAKVIFFPHSKSGVKWRPKSIKAIIRRLRSYRADATPMITSGGGC